jgi:hypothetical protein
MYQKKKESLDAGKAGNLLAEWLGHVGTSGAAVARSSRK